MKNDLLQRGKIILVVCSISLALSFFYDQIVVENFEPFSHKINNVLKEPNFPLPRKDNYLIKIDGPKVPDMVFINDKKVEYFYLQHKAKSEAIHLLLEKKDVRKNNDIWFKQNQEVDQTDKYRVKITNYMGKIQNSVFLLFDGEYFLVRKERTLLFLLLRMVLIIFILWRAWKFFAWIFARSGINIADHYGKYFFSYLGCLLFFYFVCFLSAVSREFTIIFRPHFFVLISCVLILLAKIPVYMWIVTASKLQDSFVKKRTSRIFKPFINFQNSPLSQKLIIFFSILIIAAVFELLYGFTKRAEVLTNYAYLMLFLGVIGKVFNLSKKNKGK